MYIEYRWISIEILFYQSLADLSDGLEGWRAIGNLLIVLVAT